MSDRNPDSQAAAAESWSRYWASGALHSCPNAFAGNYDEEVTAHQDRLRAIAQAAYSRQDIDEFCELAAAAGFAVEAPRELLRRGRDLMGWVVSARRS